MFRLQRLCACTSGDESGEFQRGISRVDEEGEIRAAFRPEPDGDVMLIPWRPNSKAPSPDFCIER